MPAGRRAPAQTIVYRTCPACRETTLDTAEGPLRIAPERVEELAPLSNRVLIPDEAGARGDGARNDGARNVMPPGEVDAPNSARLTRQVVCRDGMKCANPGCGSRRNLQAHHIVQRARGGRSARDNEVTVCDVCHALLHQGLLEVTGSEAGGLLWCRRPRPAGAQVRDADALRAKLDALVAPAAAPPQLGRAVRR